MNFELEMKRLQLEKDIFSLQAAICDNQKSKILLLKQIEQLEQKINEWKSSLEQKQLELDELLSNTK